MGPNTSAYCSCSATLNGELFVFGGTGSSQNKQVRCNNQTSADSTVCVLSLSRFLSGISRKSCPVSICRAGQGRDRAVRTFGLLVRRRLVITIMSVNPRVNFRSVRLLTVLWNALVNSQMNSEMVLVEILYLTATNVWCSVFLYQIRRNASGKS